MYETPDGDYLKKGYKKSTPGGVVLIRFVSGH